MSSEEEARLRAAQQRHLQHSGPDQRLQHSGPDQRLQHSGPDQRLPPPDPRAHSAPDQRARSSSEIQPLPETSSSPNLVGRRIGPYRITRLIAQGGMGAVFEAHHDQLHRAVALKILLASGGASPEDIQRFHREAQAASRLVHPNLVSIHDVGQTEGIHYLAMELVHGRTLHDMIRTHGPLDPPEALRLVRGAATGLAHAHLHGILHRDLKPANIIVTEDGTPRVTDFGVAKTAGNSRLTATGIALGTPNYMSPEQAMGHNEHLDARTDVYGLGAILYEALTGHPPFDEGGHVLTMQAVVNDDVRPPRTHRPDLARPIEDLCLRCLAKTREDRFDSCERLIASIDAALSAPTHTALTAQARRQRSLGVALAALGLALLALALWARRATPTLPSDLAQRAQTRLEHHLDAAGERADTLGDPATASSLRQAVLDDLGPLDPTAIPIIEEALGDLSSALGALDTRRAAAWLLHADAADPDSDERFDAWAHAATAAPHSKPGRAARAQLALALLQHPHTPDPRLATSELQALAHGDDTTAWEAARTLTRASAAQTDWDAAAAWAEHALTDPHLEDDDRTSLLHWLALARLLRPGPDVLDTTRLGATRALALQNTQILSYALPWDPDDMGLAPEGRWTFPDDYALRRVYPADHDGDGRDEAFVLATKDRYLYAGTVDLDPRVPLEFTPRLAARGLSLAAAATGDVDGDRTHDLVLSDWANGNNSLAFLGTEGEAIVLRLFEHQDADPYGISDLAVVDFDADRRGQVVVAPSAFSNSLALRILDLRDGSFVSQAQLPVGYVTHLHTYALPADRQGVLAIVDFDQAHQHALDRLGRRDEQPAWLGRDGVYLIEDRGQGPQLVARWTFGPDAPPSTDSASETDSIRAAVVSLEGDHWLLRLHGREDDAAHLDLVPLSDLHLDRNAPPALSLDLDRGPLLHTGNLTTGDVDGDGDLELLAAGRILGTPGPSPTLPPPPPTRSPADLHLWIVRLLHNLERPELARAWTERLDALRADPWWADLAARAPAEHTLALAERAQQRAQLAFARGDRAAGRAAWEEGLRGFERAAAATERRLEAASPDLPPDQVANTASLAAHAWARAGDVRRAAQALQRGLDLVGLNPERHQALRANLTAQTHAADLARWELDLADDDAWSNLHVAHPGRTLRTDRGAELICGPQSAESLYARLRLEDALPLSLGGALRIGHHAWATRVFMGLRPQHDDASFGDPLLGLELDLWDVRRPHLRIRARVGNHTLASAALGPGFHHTLSYRLDLYPDTLGGLRARLSVWDAAGELILAHDAPHPLQDLPRSLCLGVWSDLHPDPRDASIEQSTFAMQTPVRVDQLWVAARGAHPDQRLPLPTAHADLVAGRLDLAIAAYDALAEDAHDGAEASYYRGIARGRRGDPDAHQDVLRAFRQRPYQTLLGIEDALEVTALDSPADRRTLTDACTLLQNGDDPLLAALARQLTGDESTPSIDSVPELFARNLTMLYLGMRTTHHPNRWSPLPDYRARLPHGRLPRTRFPQVLPVVPDHLDDDAYQALVEQPRQCYHRAHQALLIARCARPQDPTPRLRLAQLYVTNSLHGMAEATLRQTLDLPLDPPEAARVHLTLAKLHVASHDTEQALAAVEAAARAGATAAQLDELSPSLGDAPRFQRALTRARD